MRNYRRGVYEEPDTVKQLRQAANANLAQLIANRDAPRPESKEKKTELQRATADDIERGHMVVEMRALRKIEERYARRKTLSDDEHAHWEEVDARLETLREELQHFNRDELRRFSRIYKKSLRQKVRID